MNSRRVRWIILGGVAFLAIAFAVAVFLPVPPHGRFSTPYVMNTADAYYELSGGKVTQVVFGGERGREGREHRYPTADYHREHDRWVATSPDGATCELRATPLSLHIIGLQPPYQTQTLYRYEVYTGR